MSSTSPLPAARRTGVLFSKPVFYELRQLRNQLKLISYLSAAYAGFDSLERQVGQIMSRAEWVAVGAEASTFTKKRRRPRSKRAPR